MEQEGRMMCTCSSCNYWEYTRLTEENYGIGVGLCRVDGSRTVCDHKCPFCKTEAEDDN